MVDNEEADISLAMCGPLSCFNLAYPSDEEASKRRVMPACQSKNMAIHARTHTMIHTH